MPVESSDVRSKQHNN